LDPTVGNEQAGFHPILIISNNIFNERSGTVFGLDLTSQPQRAGFPLVYEIIDAAIPKRSWVKISQIRTLSILRLREKICAISPEEMEIIIEGLNEIIDE